MDGSNEFVECFCWGAVVEADSWAVARYLAISDVGALQSINRIPAMGGFRPPAGGFLRIHLREGEQIPCSMRVFLGWASIHVSITS